ncbi:hypothetical protein GCM10011374_35470 [Kocuria dechangensis]|uniref:Uncharacterized protein n=1 Tax=Kocuria dechangensis TaxID=1176249 RepID=A0A917M0V4_9MICC|nr:hypothetical protein [Kocuria dechangensis]GGG68075.1 hypothetical protein GCM10011374_35470 [Kocuria dechangensis]
MAKITDNYDRDREKVTDFLHSRTGEITFFVLAVSILLWAVIF